MKPIILFETLNATMVQLLLLELIVICVWLREGQGGRVCVCGCLLVSEFVYEWVWVQVCVCVCVNYNHKHEWLFVCSSTRSCLCECIFFPCMCVHAFCVSEYIFVFEGVSEWERTRVLMDVFSFIVVRTCKLLCGWEGEKERECVCVCVCVCVTCACEEFAVWWSHLARCSDFPLPKQRFLRSYPTIHRVPSVAYCVFTRRRKLKPEFQGISKVHSQGNFSTNSSLSLCVSVWVCVCAFWFAKRCVMSSEL